MNTVEKQFNDLRYQTGCYYTIERNKQIILYLLKKYGINQVVVSPGATNFALVGSMQHDSFFQMFSCVDERAAAYMAIGIAEKSGNPVVLSCTGATASRNYMAALTYAYKRNLPILVITSSLSLSSVGHLKAQVTDREHSPVDMIWRSYQFDNIKDSEDEWRVNVKCNEAITQLLLYKKPIHINVCTTYSMNFSVKELPQAKYIPTYTSESKLPSLPNVSICVFIGSHKKFSNELIVALEKFCDSHNAIVLCDHTSGYNGKYRVNMALPFGQDYYCSRNRKVELLIHLGEISGDYYSFLILPQKVWRINTDGAYSDFFKKLTAVFKMDEVDFFNRYASIPRQEHPYYDSCLAESQDIYNKRPEVPFSNIWIADFLHDRLPDKSQLHLGILNTLRSWDFFRVSEGIESKSNVGGFGIDGCVSSLIGAAMASPEKIFIGIVGDLTFYYDANILLNNNLPNNFRLIVINNGRGVEFRNYTHPASISFGKAVEPYIAAAGHFGNQTNSAICELCKHSDIEYASASNKEEFEILLDSLICTNISKAIVVEAFTDPLDESVSLQKYKRCAGGNFILYKIKTRAIYLASVILKLTRKLI